MQALRQLPANIWQHEHGAHRPLPGLLLVPARVALPLIRWPVGYELCRPFRALCLRLILMVLVYFFMGFYPPAVRGWLLFPAYLTVSLLAEFSVFAQRVIGQQRGEEIHTTEAGWSHLTWRTGWPVFLCEQVIVPASIAGTGYVVAQAWSFTLGWWLVLTGASLGILARWESARRWKLTRSTVDQMLQAQLFGSRVEQHEARAYNPLDGKPGERTQPRGQEKPDKATLGGGEHTAAQPDPAPSHATAEPPDAASFTKGGGTNPEVMTWLRGRRG